MPNFSKHEVVLVRVIFANQSGAKIRPAAIVSGEHTSQDVFIVPFTSKITGLLAGEFVINDWASAGLNVPTAVKRGLYTVHQSLVLKSLGFLNNQDALNLEQSLKSWLGLK